MRKGETAVPDDPSKTDPTPRPAPSSPLVKTGQSKPAPPSPANAGGGDPVRDDTDKQDDIVALDEVKALIRYVSRRGDIDPQAELVKPLAAAVRDAETAPPADGDRNLVAVLEQYTKLTALTYPSFGVNGRTILETEIATGDKATARKKLGRRYGWRRYRASIIAIALFLVAMALETLRVYFATRQDPNQLGDFLKLIYYLNFGTSHYLVPACWGGIGACVFILKRLSDSFGYHSFDYSRMHGDAARILLGGALGVVVVAIFFPDFSEPLQDVGGVRLGPATMAFLAGLSVRVVYEAFEQLVQFLSDKMTGKQPKPADNG